MILTIHSSQILCIFIQVFIQRASLLLLLASSSRSIQEFRFSFEETTKERRMGGGRRRRPGSYSFQRTLLVVVSLEHIVACNCHSDISGSRHSTLSMEKKKQKNRLYALTSTQLVTYRSPKYLQHYCISADSRNPRHEIQFSLRYQPNSPPIYICAALSSTQIVHFTFLYAYIYEYI